MIVAALTGLTPRPGMSQDEQARSRGWDPESAAKYLDERMDVWFANAKKLRTGEGEAACVSCHTTVPYVMARRALRRVMGMSGATTQERRILEETARRVETYGSHQLLYEANERKKAESRGTEAVLNVLMLASADAGDNRRELSGATRQAFERMWEMQRPDGAWDWLDFGLEPLESIDAEYHGAALAALAVGMAPGLSKSGAGVEKLRGYLQGKYASRSLFDRAWMLTASARWKDLLTAAQREALIREIEGRQGNDGGWALEALGGWRWSKTEAPFQAPGKPDASLLAKPDGYATGLLVWVLREAGLPASHPAVSRGLEWLRANQRDFAIGPHTWRAWRAHSLNFDREQGGEKGEPWRRMFMSDAATTFAVLALAGVE